jgi:nucleotide-binding universal stress UspA family protein
MALTTILVHLARDADAPARLAVAESLAKAHGAHLTALFLSRSLGLPPEIAGRGLSRAFLEGEAERAAESARSLEEEFRERASRRELSHDWIVADAEHLEALQTHAHAADLIIVSRGRDETLEDRVRLRLAEELVLVTGLPVLILPDGYAATAAALGRRVLVGWKATREAVRALRDALPILQRAERVLLTAVRPAEGDAVAALEITQYLARQGITADTIDVEANAGGIAATLLAVAEAHGCDLIVAGAYGHSRLREVLFGGVTRTLFRSSRLPLLLSH